jgi:hypothetical protein
MDEHPVCLRLQLLKLFNSMHALTTIIVTHGDSVGPAQSCARYHSVDLWIASIGMD